MYSMTGYGKGVATKDGISITIEIKTVNNKGLDWGLKLPRNFIFLEDAIKKTISKQVARGHVDVFLTYQKTEIQHNALSVDVALAKNYLEIASALSKETGLENDVTLSSLMRVPEVVVKDETKADDEELLKSLAIEAVTLALDALKAMRLHEGTVLKGDLSGKLDNMQTLLDVIITRAPKVVEEYKSKLNDRIKELCAPQVVDASRLATEVALFADRCAIDEEITRLGAHIAHAREVLDQTAPKGRTLDFIVQEFIRETNTIGSKANDLVITEQVLALKGEIEKFREQAANVE